MYRNRIVGIAAAAAVMATGTALACSNTSAPDSQAGTFYGPSRDIGQGSARAWVQTAADGAPTAIGIDMTEQALLGLPAVATPPNPSAVMLTLTLPSQAAGTGFDHAELGWNPQGHEPAVIYGAPHFDLHFYMVSSAKEMAILPSDPQYAAKAAHLPAAAYVPVGYVPPPGPAASNAVPQMGLHWTSTSAPEFHGQPFSSTFIYGSWDGDFIFLEPMITKAYLETHPNLTQAIPQPASWGASGRFPKTYSVKYDATAKTYRVTLSDLTKQTAAVN